MSERQKKSGKLLEEKNRKAELLAPAGSMETLKAVAVAGADAVYCAGNRFGARAYANNFSEEELLYAIDYMHLHNKRLYLTVNTLLKEQELNKELYDYVLPLYRQGLDGVIVQDLGVLSFLREHFPGMELHASTQMNITGPHGAQLLKDMGCNRIVTARELSLEEIREIHEKVDIEIESFIHGALCYCYSGQCLLSSMLGGRSGNRGRCAQPCRLPYKTKKSGEAYLLSPKDLCTIELLPQILDSGVFSLKIEGRMKQAEYAAGVTSIYREYLDRCLLHSTEEYKVLPEDLKRLEELGSRSGFTKGYYIQHNGPKMMTMDKPAHSKSNDALQEEMRTRFLNKEIQEKINGILILSKGFPAKLVLQCQGEEISVTGDLVQTAKSRPMEQSVVEEKVRKTGGTGFVFDKLDIQMDGDIFILVGALNQLRRDAIDRLREKLVEGYRRNEMPETSGTWEGVPKAGIAEGQEAVFCEKKQCSASTSGKGKSYLAVAVSNERQLEQVLQYDYIDRIYIDSSMIPRKQSETKLKELVAKVHSFEKEAWLLLPYIMRQDTSAWYAKHMQDLSDSEIDGVIVGNYEGFQLLTAYMKNVSKKFIILTDSSLYAWSQTAVETLVEAGADEITLPLEANESELRNRGFAGGELQIYGYLPLMVSAQCVVKNTEGCRKQSAEYKNAPGDRCSGLTPMTDRYGKVFTVKNQCQDCYNVIYNTSPLSLLHQHKAVEALQVSGYRISFVKEKEKEIDFIMKYFEKGFLKKEKPDMQHYLKDFTNGHFKRGVE